MFIRTIAKAWCYQGNAKIWKCAEMAKNGTCKGNIHNRMWPRHVSVKGMTTQQESTSEASSVNSEEVAKFDALAGLWWDTSGPYGALHRLNYARSPFIRLAVCDHYGKKTKALKPFAGLSVLEVGCGGGILSESVARMGAEVLAIDASKESVHAAKQHAQEESGLTGENLVYLNTTAEELAESKHSSFDVVISSEVIEHVRNPPEFCKTLASLVKPEGIIIISTISRTIWSYGLAIVAAERILGFAPKGTHDWTLFITPEELSLMFEQNGFDVSSISGMSWNVLGNQFELSDDLSTNYIAAFKKINKEARA